LAGAAGCAVWAKAAPPRLTAANNDKASAKLRLKLTADPLAFGFWRRFSIVPRQNDLNSSIRKGARRTDEAKAHSAAIRL
jgi:hypothetical protein